MRCPAHRLSPELQTLSDAQSAASRLSTIRAWLVVMSIFNAVMVRTDALSGPEALHIGMVMRLGINLPLAFVLFVTLPYLPDRARTWLFAAFNLVLLSTLCIQAHYALPAYSAQHIIGAGVVIGGYNLLIPDTLRRAIRFTTVATLLFLTLMAAPIGLHPARQWDLMFLITVLTVATLRVRNTMDIGAREAFLLRMQDAINTQDVLFANQVLVDLSNTDPLTRVASRRCFDEQLDARWQTGAAGRDSLGLLMVDVDFFKAYNDLYGHPAGDLCLRSVAQAMAHELRHGKDMVARYGGEEFAIMLPGLSLAEVQHIGDRLCRRIEALALPHAGRPDGLHCVTVSIGVITSAEVGSSAACLVKTADQALYEAKRRGRNRVCSGLGLPAAQSPDAKLLDSRIAAFSHATTLAEDLRNAMLGGHLHLHYQPIHETRSGDIVAAEVLLRWTHKQRGAIAPGEFIPAAEESGIIVPVGKWVLRQACAEAASWAIPAMLAVNISPVQFSDPGIVETVAEILAETGLAPQRLLLEITEGLQLTVCDGVRETLEGLQGLGVAVALDDFGTGYANLSRLRDLPFDVVKIDRSFLEPAETVLAPLDVLTPLVAFARAFAPKIVMEGVEKPDQLAIVQRLGCDWVQGFHLSRPMPPDMLRTMMRAKRPAEALLLQ